MNNVVSLVLFVLLLRRVSCEETSQKTECRCGKTFGLDIATRVVGGAVLNENIHPFLVIVMTERTSCGGTIITNRFVLTAGHCLNNVSKEENNPQVIAGLHDRLQSPSELGTSEKKYEIGEIIMHNKYMVIGAVPYYDIALGKTTTKIEFNDYIQPICLPFGVDIYKFKAGMVIGWGNTKYRGNLSRYPRGSYLSLLTQDQCSKTVWKRAINVAPYSIMLCAYQKNADACQGDSGGPLVVVDEDTFFQIGIVSFGEGCASDGIPGVYTRVSTFLNWIKEHVTDDELCSP